MVTTTKQNFSVFSFLGLMQTDGSFSFQLGKDRSFDPRVFLSIAGTRWNFLEEVLGPFLLDNNIGYSFEPNSKAKALAAKRGVNVKIQRQAQVSKLINLIDNSLHDGEPLLMDSKLHDYLLFKKAYELNKCRTALNTPLDQKNDCLAKMCSIKRLLSDYRDAGPESLTTSEWASRYGLDEKSITQAARPIWEETTQKAIKISENLVAKAKNYAHIDEIPQDIGEFLAGLMDGDGSFQISVNVVVDKNGKKVPGRPVVSIQPLMNITNESKNRMPNRIFDLFAAVFKDAQPYIFKPSHKKTAERYQLKKKTVLLKSVVPFFERFPLLFFRNAKRFQSFKLVLKALAKFPFKTVTCFGNKKDRTQLVLKKLYNCDIEIFDPSLRRRTLEEMLELLELDFKKFKIN